MRGPSNRLSVLTAGGGVAAVLLAGDKPLRLSAHMTDRHDLSSIVTSDPDSAPATKSAARYLSPCLESRDRAASLTASSLPNGLE